MSNSLQVLIVGCGYLGTRVGARFLERGYGVRATTRTPGRLPELESLGFDPAPLDLAHPGESAVWREEYASAVYAVAPGRGGNSRVAFRDGPIACARKLLDQPAGRLRKFVLISSTGVYSESDGGWVDEDSAAEPAEERLRWLREAEDELRGLAQEHGFPAVVLRLGGLYGPGRSPLEWLRRPEMRERIARSRGDGWMNWIRVEDAALVTELAAERGRPGEIYIGVDGHPIQRHQFYGTAAALVGLHLPEFAKDGDLGKRCSAKKAERELGFRPQYPTVQEGLSELA
jgi:nucleoside-diphosphate-sugar epimerase